MSAAVLTVSHRELERSDVMRRLLERDCRTQPLALHMSRIPATTHAAASVMGTPPRHSGRNRTHCSSGSVGSRVTRSNASPR